MYSTKSDLTDAHVHSKEASSTVGAGVKIYSFIIFFKKKANWKKNILILTFE